MSQEVKDFFTTYSDFVTKVTSNPSLDLDALKKSMDDIESESCCIFHEKHEQTNTYI